MRGSTARIAALLAGLLLIVVGVIAAGCSDRERTVILATTTSTENSGLLDALLPVFEAETGFHVRVIAVGSGAALRLGEQGDADVILAHAPASEIAFVEAGYGIDRMRVMYNDFVIVGPPSDPAGIAGTTDATEAFRLIAESGAAFASRADDSGTHQMELAIWQAAGIDKPAGRWYIETGQGMGATLTIAAERDAYVLTDRATWLEVVDPDRLLLLVESDERLRNVYHMIVVNPSRHDHDVNVQGAQALRAFLAAPETQQRIGEFGVERFGVPLFVPYAE